jgi:O-antigen/teichoic acid export membrane protein
MLRVNLYSTLLPALAIALLSPLLENLYGASFAGLAPVIVIAAISSVFESICDTYVQEFISVARNWIILAGHILRNYGSLLIALPLLIHFGGKYGALIAYAAIMVAQILYSLMLHMLYKRTTDRG